MIRHKPYYLYRDHIYRKIQDRRGATRLLQFLQNQVFQSEVEAVPNGYRYRQNDTAITLPEKEHLRELVFKDLIDGYLQHYTIQPGDTIIDAGVYPANFTMYAAKRVGNDGRVFAVEPQPHHADLVRRVAELNNVSDRVTVVESGLWSKDTTLSFESTDNGAGNVDDSGDITVPVTTLDDLCASHGISPDFVKMDVEGAELAALAGARDVMADYRPEFAIASYHIVDGEDTSTRLEDRLEQYGYLTRTGHPLHQTTYGTTGEVG